MATTEATDDYWRPRPLATGEQVVMASRIGIDEATFSRLIHANTWPSRDTFEKIARLIDSDIPGAVAWVWEMRRVNRSTVMKVAS